MVKLYYGRESAKIRQIKRGIIKSCQYPEMDLLITDSFSDEVVEFTQCLSMLGGNRVALVELDALTADERLASLIEHGTDAQVYIIARSVDSRTQVYKQLKADAVALTKLTRSELHESVRHGVSADILSDTCLDYLIDISGYESDDTVTYDTLRIYIRQLRFMNRAVTREDVAFVVHHDDVGQVWDLFSLLVKQDMKGFWEKYRTISESRIGLLSVMLRNARLGYKASLCRRAGMKDKDIAARLNVSPYSFSYSKSISADALCEMIGILQSAVNSIKSGADEELITVSSIMRLFALLENN